ncbi:9669_t:CDS:2 [Rhizophagus irregularis]|nr:9669_t:CDS:2 [Rhizophagus irregularis]
MKQLGYQINQPSNMVIVTANGTKVHALGVITELPVHLITKTTKTPINSESVEDELEDKKEYNLLL